VIGIDPDNSDRSSLFDEFGPITSIKTIYSQGN